MTPEQKLAAGEYARATYCLGSDDSIECDVDAHSSDSGFSEGTEGVFVKGWLWVPAAAIPGYQP